MLFPLASSGSCRGGGRGDAVGGGGSGGGGGGGGVGGGGLRTKKAASVARVIILATVTKVVWSSGSFHAVIHLNTNCAGGNRISGQIFLCKVHHSPKS